MSSFYCPGTANDRDLYIFIVGKWYNGLWYIHTIKGTVEITNESVDRRIVKEDKDTQNVFVVGRITFPQKGVPVCFWKLCVCPSAW